VSQRETGNADSPGAQQFPPAMTAGAEEQPPAPEIDITKPHVARMYDYFLGGKNNYAADRAAAEQVLKVFPLTRLGAWANRRFMIESVRWLVQEAGIRQFLDIGSGLPTQQNVHEVAQSIDKDARVVYVDNDPLVRVHAEVLLATTPNTVVLEADVRDPKALLERPEVREHLDFSRPVGLLLVAVLHFVQDTEQAYEIVKTLCDALPSGSYLVLSHVSSDGLDESVVAHGRAAYNQASSGMFPRTKAEIAGFFTGLTPVGDGPALLADWKLPGRPDGVVGDGNVVPLGDPGDLRKIPWICGIARVGR
jgi:Protein of unknown function (DUF574).